MPFLLPKIPNFVPLFFLSIFCLISVAGSSNTTSIPRLGLPQSTLSLISNPDRHRRQQHALQLLNPASIPSPRSNTSRSTPHRASPSCWPCSTLAYTPGPAPCSPRTPPDPSSPGRFAGQRASVQVPRLALAAPSPSSQRSSALPFERQQ
jgi:hypothetical protein